MYKSNVSSKEHLQVWKQLNDEDHDWEALKLYFIKKYEEELADAKMTVGRGTF